LLAKKIDISSLKSLPKYAKVVKVWAYVINALTRYTGDKRDNWQLHPITILRGTGDCEDGVIVFLDACRMVGISASQAFNTVGNTSFGYHSYPIVWFDDADLVGTKLEGAGKGWYIFETTLDYVPTAPKKLNGSEYWCEGGLQNWLYYGNVKPENVGEFNGVKMPTATGSVKGKRIDNSKLDKEGLKKYWRDDFVCQQI
jgi:transglutaminase-like putative cysteine protease